MIKYPQKQSYLPFLEAFNYNPLNNKQPIENYYYYKYTNSVIDSTTEFFHTIDSSIDGDVNILYVGGGGEGGSAWDNSGGGGGGSGGEVLITKVSKDSFFDNKIKFQIGNINVNTTIYNFKKVIKTITAPNGTKINTYLSYQASKGNKGGNGSQHSTNRQGGNGGNGIQKKNNVDLSTTGYGSGAGGGGGGYSGGDNGEDGEMYGFKNGTDCGYDQSTYRCPWFIKISDIGDGTGEVRTSYGGWGHAGNENGSDGGTGYVLIYYKIDESKQDTSTTNNGDINLRAGNIYYGYNPIGKYKSQNNTNSDFDWCYIHLTQNGDVNANDIRKINKIINGNSYNIISVGGGGGGGGPSMKDFGGGLSLRTVDANGGGGGAGGECKEIINISKKIGSISVGNTGDNGYEFTYDNNFGEIKTILNGNIEALLSLGFAFVIHYKLGTYGKQGENTIVKDNYGNTILNSSGGNGGGGACAMCSQFLTVLRTVGSSNYVSKYAKKSGRYDNVPENTNLNKFSPAGGASKGLDFDILGTAEATIILNAAAWYIPAPKPLQIVYKTQDATDISEMTNCVLYNNTKLKKYWRVDEIIGAGINLSGFNDLISNKILDNLSYTNYPQTKYTMYDIFKGDMDKNGSQYFYNGDENKSDGYRQIKSGNMTMIEVNSHNGGSAYQSGNKVVYNFKNTDSTVDTDIVISRGGDGADVRHTNEWIKGYAGNKGSNGYVLIWFKKPFSNIVFKNYASGPAKQTFLDGTELTNYNPLNNGYIKGNNYNYYLYKKTGTDLTHTIASSGNNLPNDIVLDSNGSGNINILFVGGGGYGGGSGGKGTSGRGGGGGGGGGEVCLIKVDYKSLYSSSTEDVTINLNVGKVGNQTSVKIWSDYNVSNEYTAKVGNYGKNGTDNKGDNGNGGDGGAALPTYTDGIKKSYGGGGGGGGGGYSGGSRGDTQSPRFITISDIGDGLGPVNLSYGADGGSGLKSGSSGADGFVLIYYKVYGIPEPPVIPEPLPPPPPRPPHKIPFPDLNLI